MQPVVHFEIPAEDIERAKEFYSTVFAWNHQELPDMDYTLILSTEMDEKGKVRKPGTINGGMFKREHPFDGPVIAINVESIDDSLEEVKDNGGEVVIGKTVVGNMGFTAYFRDTEGNLIGLWEASGKNT